VGSKLFRFVCADDGLLDGLLGHSKLGHCYIVVARRGKEKFRKGWIEFTAIRLSEIIERYSAGRKLRCLGRLGDELVS
jgi:hypothetical protein